MNQKLKIFKTVADLGSFTKASKALELTQPAISKAIKLLETQFEQTFFKRLGSRIEMTKEGEQFLIYANRILSIESEMEDYFLNLNQTLPSLIKLGASTTLAQYTLPTILAQVKVHFTEIKFSITAGNTDQIEQLILDEQLDYGVVEGTDNKNLLHYEPFLKDEIVLITSVNNSNAIHEVITTKELEYLPLVTRERGSGTRDIIEESIDAKGVELKNIQICLGSTEGIKTYVQHSNAYAFVSIQSIQNELKTNQLKIIDVKDIDLCRWFYFVSRQGYHSKSFQWVKDTFTDYKNG